MLLCTTPEFSSAAQLDQLSAGGTLVRVCHRCWSGHKLCHKINSWSLCGNWWWYCLVHHLWRSWVQQISLLALGSHAISAWEVGHRCNQILDNWHDFSMFQGHWLGQVYNAIYCKSLPGMKGQWQLPVESSDSMIQCFESAAQLTVGNVLAYFSLHCGPRNVSKYIFGSL